MAYSYDAEKEKLVRLCEEQGKETLRESFEIDNVKFDISTRKCTINYTKITGKRTIKKRFTYMGVQYKLLNDWAETRKSLTKTLNLTNKAIEELNKETDEIVVAARDEIIKALPDSLKPSWERIKVEIEKLNEEEKRRKTMVESKYYENDQLKISIDKHNSIISDFEIELEDKNKTLKIKQTALTEIGSKLKELNSTAWSRFFSYFEIKSQEKSYYRYQNEIAHLESTIEDLNKNISLYSAELKELDAHYDSSLISQKRAELSNIDKWVEEEKKRIFVNNKPLPNNVSNNRTTVKKPSAGPTEEWKKEERRKLNRIYEDGLTLRDYILKRDNYTCQSCGNSTKVEPNLLLEVDHITPVSKYGPSIPENLQTLCWKCNRAKSDKD